MSELIGIGGKLPNGSTVLAWTDRVILAKNEWKEIQEYVTWRWNGKDLRSTWSGNYFGSLAQAAADFERRCELPPAE